MLHTAASAFGNRVQQATASRFAPDDSTVREYSQLVRCSPGAPGEYLHGLEGLITDASSAAQIWVV